MPRPHTKISSLLKLLRLHYSDAHCSLVFANAYQLLVATILSAQCTDTRVNQITPRLFVRFPDPQTVAGAPLEEIKEYIRSAGFFNHKARNIQECCRRLVASHHGQVPDDMESLLALPGVGRKTANVIRGVWFDIPGIVVDTHVARISRRLGLTDADTPERIEQDLMQLLPRRQWTSFGHRIIQHGRQVCLARSPRCHECMLREWCDFYKGKNHV